MSGLTADSEAWRVLGHGEEFHGHRVHCFFKGSVACEGRGPLLVFLHGFPTCSYDWAEVVGRLPYAVLAFDFLGFGLSDKPWEHTYTLSSHADLTLALIGRHLPNDEAKSIYLIAHDMGTSVCAEILARDLDGTLPRDIDIAGAILCNGNMVMDKASLILSQRILRSSFGALFAALSNKTLFMWQFGSVSKNPHRKTEHEDQWALLTHNNGHKLLHKTIAYTFERVERGERLHGAIRDTTKPLTFAWGMDDPVATAKLQLEAWKKLRPGAFVYNLDRISHYPQLQNPQLFADILIEELKKLKL